MGEPTPILPEVMMNVPHPEALLHVVMNLIRQQTELLKGISDKQSSTDNTLADIRERIIRLEVAEHPAKIKGLEERIQRLETEKSERHGAKKLVEWFSQFGWAILTGVGVYIYSLVKGDK